MAGAVKARGVYREKGAETLCSDDFAGLPRAPLVRKQKKQEDRNNVSLFFCSRFFFLVKPDQKTGYKYNDNPPQQKVFCVFEAVLFFGVLVNIILVIIVVFLFLWT